MTATKGKRKTWKTINRDSKVLFMVIKCGKCEKKGTYAIESITVGGNEQDCEICGSHGSVTAIVTCSYCQANLTIEINSW